MNRQLWMRQVLPALQAKPLSQKNRKTENQQLGILNPSLNPNMITNVAHTAARVPASAPPSAAAPCALCAAQPAHHRLPGALRLLQSFTDHLDNELVTVDSPLDSRDAPDVVLALVLQILITLKELVGDLELVIGVNPHPRHVDVPQFGCDQVLHCVHVFFVVVGNTPRSGQSAHELAMLALPRYSSHQNVIAYREMRQSLTGTAARAVVTTIGVDALQHLRQELLLGIHQIVPQPTR